MEVYDNFEKHRKEEAQRNIEKFNELKNKMKSFKDKYEGEIEQHKRDKKEAQKKFDEMQFDLTQKLRELKEENQSVAAERDKLQEIVRNAAHHQTDHTFNQSLVGHTSLVEEENKEKDPDAAVKQENV